MKNKIEICLKEPADYKNKYNDKILSYELSNYILEETKGIEPKQKIEFIVHSKFPMSELDKDNFVDMIRNNFGADISEIMHLAKKQKLVYCSILLISIILIIISAILNISIIAQFILIFGWIFLGESICNLLYKSVESNHQIARRKQIVEAKVSFK